MLFKRRAQRTEASPAVPLSSIETHTHESAGLDSGPWAITTPAVFPPPELQPSIRGMW